MDRKHRSLVARIAALVIAIAVVLAACSGTPAGPYGGAGTPNPTKEGTGSTVYEVKVANNTTIGAFLAGEGGKTLYVLTKDAPGLSTCSGNCATAWPPFVLDTGESVKGGVDVTGSFGTITRDDGTIQVTYKDAPLYYFAGDAAAGEVNGQGVNGVWFVASPDGGPNAGSGSPSASTKPRY